MFPTRNIKSRDSCPARRFRCTGSVRAKRGGRQNKVNARKRRSHGRSTLREAEAFMKKAEAQAEDLGVRASRASWVQENFITDDTEVLSRRRRKNLPP